MGGPGRASYRFLLCGIPYGRAFLYGNAQNPIHLRGEKAKALHVGSVRFGFEPIFRTQSSYPSLRCIAL